MVLRRPQSQLTRPLVSERGISEQIRIELGGGPIIAAAEPWCWDQLTDGLLVLALGTHSAWLKAAAQLSKAWHE